MPTALVNSPFVPPEWLAAHGFTPLAAAPVPRPAAAVGEGRCALAEAMRVAMAGTGAGGGDVAVWAGPCDQMRRAGDELGARAALFRLHVPVVADVPDAREYFAEELRRLGRFLVARGGQEPGPAALSAEVVAWERRRERLREIRRSLPPKEFARRLIAWPGEAVDTGAAAGVMPSPDAIPLALLGGALTESDLGLFDAIAKAGGAVALNATDHGETALPAPLGPEAVAERPFATMAEAHCRLPAVFRRPNDALYVCLARLCAEREVRGVVVHRQPWCDLWHAEMPRLRERLGRPLLELTADVADPAPARNRLAAFVESLRRQRR